MARRDRHPFQTMLFWIVSRGNNCTYCLGHQEVKLASAGMTDDQIAALDGDWSEFTPKERAAFAFTKKLTYEPNAITDADIDRLQTHYNDAQIVEIITAVAGFNAMNRWTGALRIPQEDHRDYLTPTSEKYATIDQPGRRPWARRPRHGPARAEASPRAGVAGRGREGAGGRPQADAAPGARRRVGHQGRPGGLAGDNPPQWMRLLAILPKGAPRPRELDPQRRDEGHARPQVEGHHRLGRRPQRPRLVRSGPRPRAAQGAGLSPTTRSSRSTTGTRSTTRPTARSPGSPRPWRSTRR